MDNIEIIDDNATPEKIPNVSYYLVILDKEDETINLMTEKMRIGEIRYSTLPMEYPPTSLEGIAIVYNIETWESYESAFNNMQYSQGRPSGGGDTSDLKDKIHTEVDIDYDFIHTSNKPLLDQKSKEAKTKYLATITINCPFDNEKYKDKSKEGNHYFERLKNDIDLILLLGKLFNGEVKFKEKYLGYIQQLATFSNNQIMVICISEVMACTWIKLEYFKVNNYDSQYNI
ncbi:14540_t:CDS:2, partial [Funneliformis mosseae]